MENEATPDFSSELAQACAELEESCDKALGVTPMELYMRQRGLCWLVAEEDAVYCTDGVEKHPLSYLANPTRECSRCISAFIAEKMGISNEG